MICRIVFTLTLLVLYGQSEAGGRQKRGLSRARRYIGEDKSEAQRYYEGRLKALALLNGAGKSEEQRFIEGRREALLAQKALLCSDPCVGLICLYGKARDSSGCIMCGCNQPCNGVSCPAGQECQVVQNVATNTYSGQCFQRVMMPPCQSVSCSNTCRFGFKADDNGCRTCTCWDPCERSRCGVNERCAVDPCVSAGNCRDSGYYCVANGQLGRLEVKPSTPEGRLQAAMKECCSSASLSGSCFMTCVAEPKLLFVNYPSCFPNRNLLNYLSCIAASEANYTTLPPIPVNTWTWPATTRRPEEPRDKRGSKHLQNEPRDKRGSKHLQTKRPIKNESKTKNDMASTVATKTSPSQATKESDKAPDTTKVPKWSWSVSDLIGMKVDDAKNIIKGTMPKAQIRVLPVEDYGVDDKYDEYDALVPYAVTLYINDKGVVVQRPTKG